MQSYPPNGIHTGLEISAAEIEPAPLFVASGIGGFTILGSGEVALILDVPGLMGQLAGEKERGGQNAEATRALN